MLQFIGMGASLPGPACQSSSDEIHLTKGQTSSIALPDTNIRPYRVQSDDRNVAHGQSECYLSLVLVCDLIPTLCL